MALLNEKIQPTEVESIKKGPAVLVIDDSPVVREVISYILRLIGMEGIIARSGEEGVDLFKQHQEQIAFVFVDYNMPLMDGLETLERIRQIDGNTIFILSSTDRLPKLPADLPLQEQVTYLQKPFSINQMTDKSLAILNRLKNLPGQLTQPN